MKRDKVIYWIATGLVSAAMIMSGSMYLMNSPEIVKGFETIGYPPHFMLMLGIAKLAGAVILLAPVSSRIKEWTYAGFAFTFIGATWAHISTQTPFVAPLLFLVVLGVSYWFRLRLSQGVQLSGVKVARG